MLHANTELRYNNISYDTKIYTVKCQIVQPQVARTHKWNKLNFSIKRNGTNTINYAEVQYKDGLNFYETYRPSRVNKRQPREACVVSENKIFTSVAGGLAVWAPYQICVSVNIFTAFFNLLRFNKKHVMAYPSACFCLKRFLIDISFVYYLAFLYCALNLFRTELIMSSKKY